MFIFKSLGLKCIPFLPQIMPPFLQCMRTKESTLLKFLFKQLGLLVAIVKQHIRVREATSLQFPLAVACDAVLCPKKARCPYVQDYLEDIFALIKEYWNTSMLDQIITLVEVLSQALNDEFKGKLQLYSKLASGAADGRQLTRGIRPRTQCICQSSSHRC
jgi:FKBP12-rapamycin complex-associated protein